jgi:hypothetical protein
MLADIHRRPADVEPLEQLEQLLIAIGALSEVSDLKHEAAYEVYARRAAQPPLGYTLVAQSA